MSTKRAVSNIEHELECKLAAFVRSYIDASLSGESSYANEALIRVCSGFEYLVGHLLNERDEWRGWVDGIIPATDMVPDAIRVDSSIGFTVNGRAIWGESSRGPFWIEPFRGSVRLTEGTDALIDYEIRFADASRAWPRFPMASTCDERNGICPRNGYSCSRKGLCVRVTPARNLVE